MNRDLSKGPVVRSMLLFAIPMILGDLLQQCYNIADTLIVGHFLGEKALAAVGSSFTLMTFITSILLGLCMGSGALFSIRFGQRDENGLKEDICASFFFIAAVTLLLNMIAYVSLDGLRSFLRVPDEVWGDMRAYLFVIFMGIPAVFLYNYFTSYLRAIGNSVVPLVFLALSSVLNIILDLWFVIGLERGVAGAAQATVLSQYLSGLGIMLYTLVNHKQVRAIRKIGCLKKERIRRLTLQFKEGIMVLASFLSAGYSLENSLSLSVKELEGLYGKTGMITEEFSYMEAGVRMNRPVELLLADMGRRSGIQDVDQFAQVFAAAKRSGGELTDIISQTAGIIRDKIQVQEEIHTLTAARVFEQKIMNGIPFGIILYIDFTSPGFFHVMYETWLGRIFMTACLGIYVGAVFLAKKILDIPL